MLSQFDLFAAGTAGGAGRWCCRLLFNRTRLGLALRAVADDPLAALSVGIDLRRVWAVVWAVAGVVALVAGLLWGARVGVQFSLSLIVLKALPVLIIGGFASIAGAIVGGLIVGATEKLAEVYIGPLVGGGIENWFPYVLALLFLLVRPTGLFGERARGEGVSDGSRRPVGIRVRPPASDPHARRSVDEASAASRRLRLGWLLALVLALRRGRRCSAPTTGSARS